MSSSSRGTKMPYNNRVSSSSALRTNDIWSKTIGHNPYKNDEDDVMTKADSSSSSEHAAGLMLLARMTNVSGSEARGGCPKCGEKGHLRFQCRNVLALPTTTTATNDSDDDDNSSTSSSRSSSVDDAGRNPGSELAQHTEGDNKEVPVTSKRRHEDLSDDEDSKQAKKLAKLAKHDKKHKKKKGKKEKKDKKMKHKKHKKRTH